MGSDNNQWKLTIKEHYLCHSDMCMSDSVCMTEFFLWQREFTSQHTSGLQKLAMAESIRLKVKCHACGYEITGSAKYGTGHYVQEGVAFEFVATGKILTEKGRKVKGEALCVCPRCGVRNKFVI